MSIEINARNAGDLIEVEIGNTTITLPPKTLQALQKLINDRLNNVDACEQQEMQKKIKAYSALATKMAQFNPIVLQNLLVKLTAQQIVTLARLANGNTLYDKILENLSRQNRRQFEDDYETFNKISHHQAIVFMEQSITLIKKAVRQQKEHDQNPLNKV